MTYVRITKGKVMTKNIEVGAALNPEKRDGETLIHIPPEVIAQKNLGMTALNLPATLPRIDSSSIRYGKEIPFPKNERTYPDNKNDLEANHPL